MIKLDNDDDDNGQIGPFNNGSSNVESICIAATPQQSNNRTHNISNEKHFTEVSEYDRLSHPVVMKIVFDEQMEIGRGTDASFNSIKFDMAQDQSSAAVLDDVTDTATDTMRSKIARSFTRNLHLAAPKYKLRRFSISNSEHEHADDFNSPITNDNLSTVHHRDLLGISKVKEASSILTALGPIMFILCAFLIPIYVIPIIVSGNGPSSEIFLPLALATISSFPATLFLGWCRYTLRKTLDMGIANTHNNKHVATTLDEGGNTTTTQNSRGGGNKLSPGIECICFPLAIMLRQAQDMMPFYVKEQYQTIYSNLLKQMSAVCMFSGWLAMLDSFHWILLQYAKRVDAISVRSEKSQQMKRIMKAFGEFQDVDKDVAAAIPGGHRSAARVLAEIVGIYCNLGKCIGGVLLLLFFMGVVYSSLVALGVTVFFAGIVQALHINESFQNVFSLAISNAVHVGEIISVGRTGFAPADSPNKHVIGFVEGFTWTHVVIRDFKRRQTFIRHDRFGELTVHNWSRRPTKHAYYEISIVPELSGGGEKLAMLAKFVSNWMEEHPQIDNNAYKKSVIKITPERGLVLEVIFFPIRGAKARQVRSEFVVMVLDAAKRLNLCLMPAEVRRSTPWDDVDMQSVAENEGEDKYMNVNLEDLLPSSKLTERAGYKPKIT